MNWTTFSVALLGFGATISAAIMAPLFARRTSREDVYVEVLAILRASVSQMQVLSTFPGTDVPDIHSVNEVARVDALIRIRATPNVREKFSKTSSTLATFYGELFRVHTLSDDAPAGLPQDRYALAKSPTSSGSRSTR